MWPRHTGDFSLFRIYADKNGQPAEYSKDNVPLQVKKHLQSAWQELKKVILHLSWDSPDATGAT